MFTHGALSETHRDGVAGLINPGPCDDEWPGDAGNAVLSRYPIVERVTKPLSPVTQDCPVKRSLAGVRLDVNCTALRVFTFHLTPGHGPTAVTLRQTQARTIADYLTQSGPILFTGDLNDTPAARSPATSPRRAGSTPAAGTRPTRPSARPASTTSGPGR